MSARLALAALLAIAIGGCAPKKPADSALRSFDVTGYLESVEPDGQRLLIDHEEIPGFMPQMVMMFNLAQPAEAAKLQPGDQIRFRYHVEPTRSWIDSLQTTGLRRDPSTHFDLASPSSSALQPGEPLPDYSFLDVAGRTVSLSDYRGSVVALTFVFTRCPVPEYCPAMMRNFGNVDQILKDSPPLPAPWKLVTLSFDPEHDTPEVLQRYGKAFDYDPQNWDLLTSATSEPIEAIARNVGLKYGQRDGSYLHNLRTVVLDPEGRVSRIFTNEDWTPEELATAMLYAAAGLR